MKFNYKFPYLFHDLRNDFNNLVRVKFNKEEVKILIPNLPLYSNNEVDVLIEIESSSTFFRKIYHIEAENFELNLNQQELGSIMKYSVIVVAKSTGELSLGKNSEYYEYGDCIGVFDTSLVRIKEDEELSGLIKVGSTDGKLVEFDLTSNWITIYLPKEVYTRYVHWQKDDLNTPFILASFGFGAVQYAILKALQEEKYKENEWWQILKSIEEDLEDSEDEIPGLTNRLLGNCFEKMIESASPAIDSEDTSILSYTS